MTNLFGNICLALAALTNGILLLPFFVIKAPRGNDEGATGYVLILALFLHIVFLCLMAGAALAIERKGGFDWISTQKTSRNLLVFGGLLLLVVAAAFGAAIKVVPGNSTDWAQTVLRYLSVLTPLILVVAGFTMLNDFLGGLIPVAWYKWLLGFLSGASLICVGFVIFKWMGESPKGLNAAQSQYENAASIKADRLKEIEESDVERDMMRVLEFVGANYPQEVREKAVEKIKAKPDWAQDIVRLLESDNPVAAFDFLSFDAVEAKKMFLAPVNQGVSGMGRWVRHTIQGTSPANFYPDLFSNEVAAVLTTVEKFDGMGIDFLPALQEFRAAFEEAWAVDKGKLTCIKTLDDWIAKFQSSN